MKGLSDSSESIYLGWLASSVACCFPRLPDQSEPELLGEYSISNHVSLHMLTRAKLFKRVGRHVVSNLEPSNHWPLNLNAPGPPRVGLVQLHNGLRRGGVSLQGRRARQAGGRGGTHHGARRLGPSEHLMISRGLMSPREDAVRAFDP